MSRVYVAQWLADVVVLKVIKPSRTEGGVQLNEYDAEASSVKHGDVPVLFKAGKLPDLAALPADAAVVPQQQPHGHARQPRPPPPKVLTMLREAKMAREVARAGVKTAEPIACVRCQRVPCRAALCCLWLQQCCAWGGREGRGGPPN